MSEAARQIRTRLVDSIDIVESLGLDEGMKRQARGVMIRCPWHVERSPSCSITIGVDGTLRAHCFGCGQSGDVLHLVAAAHGLDTDRDFKRVLEEAARLAGATLDDLDRCSASRPISTSPKRSQPSRPPANEVSELWASCICVYDDLDLRRALLARAIAPGHVSDRDLARALPTTMRLPPWARLGRRTWADLGNRLVLPMHDATGQMVTLHARRIDGETRETPKGLSPAGHRVGSAVFADPLARLLLRGENVPWWSRQTVIISEGGPDFLTAATHYGDGDDQAPAVFGIIAGSFSASIGARVPSGAAVALRTHHDTAGEHYADQILRLLGTRCAVRRAPRE